MALLNFDANTVAPSAPLEPIPAGWYNVSVVGSEMKPTKTQGNAYLELELQVIDGQYAGRKVFDRLNLHNTNAVAAEIAYRTLSAICHATGVIQVADSQQLHGIPLQAQVSLREGRTEGEKTYGPSNEVKGYKAIENAGVPAQQAAPAWSQPAQQAAPPVQQQQAPAATQQAGGTPPWAGQQQPPQQAAAPAGTPPWAGQQAAPAAQAPAATNGAAPPPWANQAAQQQAPAGNTPPWAK